MAKQATLADLPIRCGYCLSELPSEEFYKSKNPLHSRGRLLYCKDCLKKIFKKHLDEFGSLEGAIYATCVTADIPFIQSVVDATLEYYKKKQANQKNNVFESQANYFGTYVSRLNTMRSVNKWDRFVDSDTNLSDMVSIEDRKAAIEARVDQFKMDWGNFDNAEDYVFLEQRYDIYTDGLVLTPAQETLYRKLCITELRARELESSGASTKEITKQITDLMGKLKIDNFAEQKEKDPAVLMLEAQIALHEEKMPMEYYEDKSLYKDACGLSDGWDRIKRGLLNFALGHKDYPKVHDGKVDG